MGRVLASGPGAEDFGGGDDWEVCEYCALTLMCGAQTPSF